MLAKKATKLLDNHLNGNPTKISNKILSDIVEQLKIAGAKSPFSISLVKEAN